MEKRWRLEDKLLIACHPLLINCIWKQVPRAIDVPEVLWVLCWFQFKHRPTPSLSDPVLSGKEQPVLRRSTGDNSGSQEHTEFGGSRGGKQQKKINKNNIHKTHRMRTFWNSFGYWLDRTQAMLTSCWNKQKTGRLRLQKQSSLTQLPTPPPGSSRKARIKASVNLEEQDGEQVLKEVNSSCLGKSVYENPWEKPPRSDTSSGSHYGLERGRGQASIWGTGSTGKVILHWKTLAKHLPTLPREVQVLLHWGRCPAGWGWHPAQQLHQNQGETMQKTDFPSRLPMGKCPQGNTN